MKLMDSAARPKPAPSEHPCQVWLPAQRAAATAHRAAAETTRPPREVELRLTAAQADDLPLWISRLLTQHAVGPGDRVTVDLADLGSVHLTGLVLLLTVLWRRVGTHGEVLLTGGSPGLRAELGSLEVTPAACRAAVYGPPPAPAVVPGPVPAAILTGRSSRHPAPLVPQQDGPRDPVHAPDRSWDARLTWSGEVDLSVDLRTQARLDDLLEQRETRTLAIDLSDVTCLTLSTLRLLLAADRRLRARGGRLHLLHAGPRVQRLLAVTHTTSLADEQPRPAAAAEPSH